MDCFLGFQTCYTITSLFSLSLPSHSRNIGFSLMRYALLTLCFVSEHFLEWFLLFVFIILCSCCKFWSECGRGSEKNGEWMFNNYKNLKIWSEWTGSNAESIIFQNETWNFYIFSYFTLTLSHLMWPKKEFLYELLIFM